MKGWRCCGSRSPRSTDSLRLRVPSAERRQLSTEVAIRFLGEMAQSDEIGRLPAFAPDRIALTARSFLDLVVLPMLLRGLFEQDDAVLNKEMSTHVARRISFFLAACRHGG